MPSEVRKMKQLEEENMRLKRLVAAVSVDKEMLQEGYSEKAVKPAHREKFVEMMTSFYQVSVKRACEVIIENSIYTGSNFRGNVLESNLTHLYNLQIYKNFFLHH